MDFSNSITILIRTQAWRCYCSHKSRISSRQAEPGDKESALAEGGAGKKGKEEQLEEQLEEQEVVVEERGGDF